MAVAQEDLLQTVSADRLIDIVQKALHASPAEWLFFRELRAGTGRRNSSLQRLDAFALNTLPHLAMKRVCYEVKVSRADYLGELKHPLKRRIGMRYSNEFYFVTPAGLVHHNEIPFECGLIEAGTCTPDQYQKLLVGHAGFFHYDDSGDFCILRIPAPWRDTPGPTWQLLASMLRHQRREFIEKPPPRPEQTDLFRTSID